MTSILNARVLLAGGVIAAVAALALGATYAAWTTQQSVTGNTVSTASISLTVNGVGVIGSVQPFNVSGLYPGQSSTEEGIKVLNSSGVPMKITYETALVQDDNSVCSYTNMTNARTFGYGGNNIPAPLMNGTVASFNGLPQVLVASLPAGQEVRLYQTPQLDLTAPNSVQGSTCGWTVVFKAETI